MRAIIKFIEGLSTGGAFLSALGMMFIVVLVVVEIFLRAVLKTSTLVSCEYGGYALVFLILTGLAYTMKEEGLIRINLLTIHFSEKGKRIADIISGIIGAAITTFALYYTTLMVYETWELEMTADTIAETPLWIPQLAIPIGMALLLLQIIAFIARRAIDDK
ncbi:TRAP transporter small permease subunit [Maridesulfovibrio hydrothermalis]|uniref:Tripartite ATP-independent periplasmic transporter DctQ component n=1 Tax=Maridesulfovibrio hydrothermalis AM13 = DSM 14728 TaxID=1121451 RepID=L0RDA0_9BACT|nr:TRAP transporter small permease [Maridesulfovibrio hydrothermalis]CCO23526.1 Tripartite ATP-independent periplasmic transporter DctQ component [Maridesulfovibrio hydrothermalis AM13 = DSM 14728]